MFQNCHSEFQLVIYYFVFKVYKVLYIEIY
nr:MAG TPA: hypothetical protein [Caudoviricetes sp.]